MKTTTNMLIEFAAEVLFLRFEANYRLYARRTWLEADEAERKGWRVLAALPPRLEVRA